MHYKFLFLIFTFASSVSFAAGVDCDTLMDWSDPIGESHYSVSHILKNKDVGTVFEN